MTCCIIDKETEAQLGLPGHTRSSTPYYKVHFGPSLLMLNFLTFHKKNRWVEAEEGSGEKTSQRKKIWRKKKREGEKEQNLMLQVVKYLGKTVQDRGLPDKMEDFEGETEKEQSCLCTDCSLSVLGAYGECSS